MKIFFTVTEAERDALLRQDFRHAKLSGFERLAWDPTGVDDEAAWVTADVDEDVARRYEDPDGMYLRYRSFELPRDMLNALSWRVVDAAEVAAERSTDAHAIQAASELARAEALEEGRRLGQIE